MKLLVLGYGASGRAAEKLARKLGYEVEIREDGAEDAVSLPAADFAVVSPGVPLTSPLIAECRVRGVPVKSELQFGCEELKRQGWKLLAVTGSKGKSSVVKVVADAINLAGMHAVACGNYGLPVSEVAVSALDLPPQPSTSRWAVVEVSSFMMETTELPADMFEAAAILNLQEDHLDRHGSVEAYHALKRKLLAFAKASIEGDVGSCDPSLFAASYFDNEVLRVNACCAAALMRIAGLDEPTICCAFGAFVPLPHRMNRIATIGGVDYIDDSKATSLAALGAGVKMCGSGIRLIAGGLPKGDDPKSVLPILTERVKKVYLIGQSAEAFAAAWKGSVDCEICGTLENAVERARCEAARDDKVLLSPGTASFDQFKSFGERGDVFARLVKKENT